MTRPHFTLLSHKAFYVLKGREKGVADREGFEPSVPD